MIGRIEITVLPVERVAVGQQRERMLISQAAILAALAKGWETERAYEDRHGTIRCGGCGEKIREQVLEDMPKWCAKCGARLKYDFYGEDEDE